MVAINLSPLDRYIYPSEVAWQISQNSKKDYSDVAKHLNVNPKVVGVILQHEFGIYGGNEGENILNFIENCQKPILTTLHTVLPNPSPKMKQVTSRIIRSSNIIVVLTHTSREILEKEYPFAIGKTYVIPHGIHQTEFSDTAPAKKKLKLIDSTILSTFGLLSRGKGIEYVLQALPAVIQKHPNIQYLILGRTHPAIRRLEGEKYRNELSDLTAQLNLKNHVKFFDQYLDLDDLIEFLKATDIYISTSINPNQAVSGTLSYALGSGRAVISTQFVQAKEIVTPNIGRLVPIKNSSAFTTALLDLLSDESALKKMHQSAYEVTRPMLWKNVAKEYSDLLAQVVLPPMNLNHLKRMTDEFGLFQFAQASNPHKEHGYTLDDNARALIICKELSSQSYAMHGLEKALDTYLRFIEKCQKPDGTFINYFGADKKPSTQNNLEDISDSYARAIWALSEVMCSQNLHSDVKNRAEIMFFKALPHASDHTHLRTSAVIIKALATALNVLPVQHRQLLNIINKNSILLEKSLKSNTDGQWHWFESYLAYNNAVLSESLLLAGNVLKNDEYTRLGIISLRFLIKETFSTNMYLPIGHSSWYKKNEKRSYFDQQPEEPASMILALTTAFRLTGHESYKNLAIKCFSWYLGNNSLHQFLYDFQTGGCFDGLHPDRVNQNQGAESLVSYILSRIAMTKLGTYENSTVS